jgi:GH35 family endo-1,4-beta-xylanase
VVAIGLLSASVVATGCSCAALSSQRLSESGYADVELFYDDCNDEGLNANSDFVYNLRKGLVSRGVPSDGVGMHMHLGKPNDTFTIADLAANLQRIVALGLEVVMREMDVPRRGGTTADRQTALDHDRGAARVAEPRRKAVAFRGITDPYARRHRYSRRVGTETQEPLGDLWDDNHEKQAAGVLMATSGR